MSTNAELVRALEARGVGVQDLEDTVMALLLDRNAIAMAQCCSEADNEACVQAIAAEADALAAGGLLAQIAWMDCYYNNRDNLTWALSGYLNLPIAA